jgi:hypothetical protein
VPAFLPRSISAFGLVLISAFVAEREFDDKDQPPILPEEELTVPVTDNTDPFHKRLFVADFKLNFGVFE